MKVVGRRFGLIFEFHRIRRASYLVPQHSLELILGGSLSSDSAIGLGLIISGVGDLLFLWTCVYVVQSRHNIHYRTLDTRTPGLRGRKELSSDAWKIL